MSWWMIILLFIYALICLFLILVILIQSGKGGGLSSLGSASQGISEALGATGAERMLNKVTTGAAIGFMVLAIAISIMGKWSVHSAENVFPDSEQVATPVSQGDEGQGAGVPGAESVPGPAPDVPSPAPQ